MSTGDQYRVKKFPWDFLACIDERLGALRSDLALLLIQQMDYKPSASASANFYGMALPGTATSASAWVIRKENLDSQERTSSILFAGGKAEPLFSWDDRLSETYS